MDFFYKSIGNNISKNLSGKYSQKLLDYAKQSATNALKTTSKIGIKKKQEQMVIFLIGNNIANVVNRSYDGKTTEVSKTYYRIV